MKTLLKWKEPRSAIKAESCFRSLSHWIWYVPLPVWELVFIAWYLWVLVNGVLNRFADWDYVDTFGIAALTFFTCSVFSKPWARLWFPCSLTPQGIRLPLFTRIKWSQVEMYTISHHFSGEPNRQVLLKANGNWHQFTFDSREVDEAKLTAIFAEYVGLNREPT